MNTTTLTDAYYSAVYSKLSDKLVKGTKTNYGIFSHWNENLFAIFENGWVGYQSLHFIEIINEETEKRDREKMEKFFAAIRSQAKK